MTATDRDRHPIAAAVVEDGSVEGFRLSVRGLRPLPIAGGPVDPAEPPLLDARARGGPRVVGESDGVELRSPVAEGDWLAAIGPDGGLISSRALDGDAAIDAPPDSRPAISGAEAVVVGGATDRYPHGVLGDELEGSSLHAFERGGTLRPLLSLEGPEVIEGTAPILAQLGGGSQPEAIVTVSDPDDGARLEAHELGTGEVWRSDPIGSGNRWRHQLAIAPFAPGGGLELASVRTPHLAGLVEFHAIEDGELVLRASIEGYSSHELGSSNLDRAVAGDFDGSGLPELALPTLDGSAIAGIERTAEGAREAWRLELDVPIQSNLTTAEVGGRLVLVAAGPGLGATRGS